MTLSKSNIETLTHRWNPVTGCSGTGCSCKDHCWAARPFRGHTPDMTVQFHPEKIYDAMKHRRPAVIGVCWGGDLWDAEVQNKWRQDVMAAMSTSSSVKHQYLLLTKQPQRIYRGVIPDLPNIWLGTSVTGASDWWRVPRIGHKQIGSTNVRRYVFLEPIIGSLVSDRYNKRDVLHILKESNVEWAAIGALTGKGASTKPEWVQQAIDLCHEAGIQMMLKRNVRPLLKGGEVRSPLSGMPMTDAFDIGYWWYLDTRPIPFEVGGD